MYQLVGEALIGDASLQAAEGQMPRLSLHTQVSRIWWVLKKSVLGE